MNDMVQRNPMKLLTEAADDRLDVTLTGWSQYTDYTCMQGIPAFIGQHVSWEASRNDDAIFFQNETVFDR